MESTLSLESLSLEGLSYDPVSLMDEALAVVTKYGGSLWIPSLTRNYINSDGTGEVSIDSPIGFVKDLSGSHDLIQATTASKPMLRNVNGKLAWEFDGVNDSLTGAAFNVLPTETLACAVSYHGALSGAENMFISHRVAKGLALYKNTSGKFEFITRNGADTNSFYTTGGNAMLVDIPNVASASISATRNILRINTTQVQSQARDGAVPTESAGLFVGVASGNTRYSDCSIYGLFFAPAEIPTQELLVVEKYLASLSGVAV